MTVKRHFRQPYIYTAQLKRVIDGDTLEVDMDLGCGVYVTQRVRLFGLNSPEKKTEGGKDSKAYVEKILRAAQGELLLCTHKDDREKYGRLLGNVFVRLDMKLECLNVMLLENKYAELFLVGSSSQFLRIVGEDRARAMACVIAVLE